MSEQQKNQIDLTKNLTENPKKLFDELMLTGAGRTGLKELSFIDVVCEIGFIPYDGEPVDKSDGINVLKCRGVNQAGEHVESFIEIDENYERNTLFCSVFINGRMNLFVRNFPIPADGVEAVEFLKTFRIF